LALHNVAYAEHRISDGSWNLRFDYLPSNMADTTIQMRPFDPRSEEQPSA
jgi:hypothetical protein